MLIGYERTSTTDQIAAWRPKSEIYSLKGGNAYGGNRPAPLARVTPWKRPSRSLGQGIFSSSPKYVGWPVPWPIWWRSSTGRKRKA